MAACKYCSNLNWSDKNKSGDAYCNYKKKYVDPESQGCNQNDKATNGEDDSKS